MSCRKQNSCNQLADISGEWITQPKKTLDLVWEANHDGVPHYMYVPQLREWFLFLHSAPGMYYEAGILLSNMSPNAKYFLPQAIVSLFLVEVSLFLIWPNVTWNKVCNYNNKIIIFVQLLMLVVKHLAHFRYHLFSIQHTFNFRSENSHLPSCFTMIS